MPDESTTPDISELTRASMEAFNRGDMEAFTSYFAPDAVWRTQMLGVYEGRAAIRAFFGEWIGTFRDYEQIVEEARELGNGVTLTVVVMRGTHGDTGRLVEQRLVLVGAWTNGLIESVSTYFDIDQARPVAERLAWERG